MLYRSKVLLMKNLRLNLWWRRWQEWRGKSVGNYAFLPNYIREYASSHTFADIGCMWGVNGEYSFIAEEAGATLVKAVDVFGPTPEFEEKKRERGSNVQFILGDAGHPETIERVGVMDVVLCAGVLYHHPSPFDLLVALRRMCGETLILRSATILEIGGIRNAAVYFPLLNERARRLWDLTACGVPKQIGVTTPFEPEKGYANYFWGFTPSCLRSMLETAGFRIVREYPEPFAHTYICSPVTVPFFHRLPNEVEAREMGAVISAKGLARPA